MSKGRDPSEHAFDRRSKAVARDGGRWWITTWQVGVRHVERMTSTRTSRTGVCPVCGTDLVPWDVLIEYERPDGEPASYAECPDCRSIVHPS